MFPRLVFIEYSKPSVTLPETSELCSENKEMYLFLCVFVWVYLELRYYKFKQLKFVFREHFIGIMQQITHPIISILFSMKKTSIVHSHIVVQNLTVRIKPAPLPPDRSLSSKPCRLDSTSALLMNKCEAEGNSAWNAGRTASSFIVI